MTEPDVKNETHPLEGESQVAKNWYDTAAQHCRNEEYYRGLVQEIGAMLGDEAFISDDGSVQQDILCAKVPELVRERLAVDICQCGACTSSIRHMSDCAVHNAPALEPGPCDCGAEVAWRERRFETA